jgi:hypothetical protein
VAHGIIDAFAFQEALLIEAVFGIIILAMIWVGFRRWLQYKEKTGRLIAEQTAERTAENAAERALIESRLKAVEQMIGKIFPADALPSATSGDLQDRDDPGA